MPKSIQRIVSLLPSTTEIVAALGYGPHLVGRSHECDVPASVQSLPTCTQPKFNPAGQSYQIDQRIKALLQEGLSVYRIDGERLAALKPDLIITQDHCEVCAASVDEVKAAARQYLNDNVTVVSVSPTNLEDVYDSIHQIAAALGNLSAGKKLTQNMRASLNDLAEQTSHQPRKKMACIEWLDPLMTAGNWVPELAESANITTVLAKAGAHSPWVEWENLLQADPQIITLMPCGYTIEQTLGEIDELINHKNWNKLTAVQHNQVYIADGHHYFNRPGPRLTDSARILAEIAHSGSTPKFKEKGWVHLNACSTQN